jgi:hypothetical protein
MQSRPPPARHRYPDDPVSNSPTGRPCAKRPSRRRLAADQPDCPDNYPPAPAEDLGCGTGASRLLTPSVGWASPLIGHRSLDSVPIAPGHPRFSLARNDMRVDLLLKRLDPRASRANS